LKNKIRETVLPICIKENRNAFLLTKCYTFVLGGGYLKVNRLVAKVEVCTNHHCKNLPPNGLWFCRKRWEAMTVSKGTIYWNAVLPSDSACLPKGVVTRYPTEAQQCSDSRG